MATADVCSWVTLATNDQYAAAALVLAQSLRSVSTVHRITVLITSTVSLSLRDVIGGVFDEVVCVDVLDSRDVANLALLCRPELGVTLTKLHAWRLTHYTKCVFLDADCLVVANCDELFAREELSAAPDIGWPDCFNSGVFVFTPSFETFDALLRLVETTGSFDGGDQGLLNEYFSCWCTGPAERRLSFLYNMVVSVTYTCLPAFKRFGQDVKIVHFLGERKPWRSTHSAADDSPSSAFYQHWHQLYRQHVVPHLPHSQMMLQTTSVFFLTASLASSTDTTLFTVPPLCAESPCLPSYLRPSTPRHLFCPASDMLSQPAVCEDSHVCEVHDGTEKFEHMYPNFRGHVGAKSWVSSITDCGIVTDRPNDSQALSGIRGLGRSIASGSCSALKHHPTTPTGIRRHQAAHALSGCRQENGYHSGSTVSCRSIPFHRPCTGVKTIQPCVPDCEDRMGGISGRVCQSGDDGMGGVCGSYSWCCSMYESALDYDGGRLDNAPRGDVSGGLCVNCHRLLDNYADRSADRDGLESLSLEDDYHLRDRRSHISMSRLCSDLQHQTFSRELNIGDLQCENLAMFGLSARTSCRSSGLSRVVVFRRRRSFSRRCVMSTAGLRVVVRLAANSLVKVTVSVVRQPGVLLCVSAKRRQKVYRVGLWHIQPSNRHSRNLVSAFKRRGNTAARIRLCSGFISSILCGVRRSDVPQSSEASNLQSSSVDWRTSLEPLAGADASVSVQHEDQSCGGPDICCHHTSAVSSQHHSTTSHSEQCRGDSDICCSRGQSRDLLTCCVSQAVLPGEQQSEAQVDLLSPSIGQLTVSDEADQRERRSAWEHGQPDYMGADRFDSILAKIDQTMSRTDSQQ